RRWRLLLAFAGLVGASAVVALLVALQWASRNAGPILRQRVIATLEERFRSPVQLDRLDVVFENGIQVSGGGLRIINFGEKQPAGAEPAEDQPMLSVDSLDFHTTVRQLLEPTLRVDLVHVRGMRLNIPPKGQRAPLLRPKKHKPRDAGVVVDKIVCSDMTLTIETDRLDKLPLVFDIHDLTLKDIGPNRPFLFDAKLVNPQPVGDIHSIGQFGPWNGDEPRDTPVQGDYVFSNADLGPIKGIAGTLSSTGKYSGTLSHIGVNGTTDTPNFSLDVSDHPVHLRTEFDATVDGTTGDTRLNHVHATFLSTSLDVTGMVMQAKTRLMQANDRRGRRDPAKPPRSSVTGEEVRGHYIDINVITKGARIEDILTLGVKARPPIMQGGLAVQAHLSIPPGKESISKKIHIQGRFGIRGATFSNANWQQTLDKFSARAEGHPKQANAGNAEQVASQMSGSFTLGRSLITIPDLQYEIPGVKVSLAGKYGLDGNTFNFAGTAQTDASASDMLTGWKHWVVMPFDPLFKKDGAGLEVPVKITGTRSDMKFGVDMGKLKKQVFSRHKDHPEIKTQDDKIVGDPARIRPQIRDDEVPQRDREPSQQ
ncbi:MAG TPA: hypothetical protein VF018_15810, partial [Acidobacteriaceae bacterium]